MRNKQNVNLEDILADRASEEDFLEVPLADKVFRFFLFLFGLIFVVVFFQFANIGLFKKSFYENRALLNSNRTKNHPAPRGVIFDRFQDPLVQNIPSFNVFLSPTDLPEDSIGRFEALDQISELLEIDSEELKKMIKEKDWVLSDKLFLKNGLSHDQLVNLMANNIPFLKIESALEREHLPQFKFSHLLGYVGLPQDKDLQSNKNLSANSEIGKSGLEAYYDNFLRGTDGKEVNFRNAKGEVENSRTLVLPKSGASLHTFIDKEFQEYFYDRLSSALKKLNRDIGVGIAINPKNGEVLTLFNIPSFNSLSIGDFLKKPDEPFFNRAISGLYTPGSTIKPLVAIAALKEGIITPSHQIYSPGFIEIPNPYDPEKPSRFLDWKPQGWVDVRSALARSSNVYFYEVGGGFENQIGLGIERLKIWWQKFRLNEKMSIDLPGEKSGFLPDPEWKEKKFKIPWRIGDTYNVSIGQGDLLITPLELLNYVSAIANGGTFYKPRVLDRITDDSGETLLENNPEILGDIRDEISPILDEVRQGMVDVVQKSYGTANLLSGLPIKIAAKTGSSQVEDNAKINAFFVGFAPVEDPEIAVLILIENAREGSLNVVPVAREVFMWYYENRLKNNI